MNILSLFQSIPDEDSAILFLEEKRWGESGVCCPHCGSVKNLFEKYIRRVRTAHQPLKAPEGRKVCRNATTP